MYGISFIANKSNQQIDENKNCAIDIMFKIQANQTICTLYTSVDQIKCYNEYRIPFENASPEAISDIRNWIILQ